MSNAISIAVPTYNYHGKSKKYLKRLFNTIEKQSFKDFNVCISDQSTNNDVVDLCRDYSDRIDIRYHKNKDLSNPTKNINKSILNADADIIKIMFMDDFFYSEDALLIINNYLSNSTSRWMVCSTAVYDENSKKIFQYISPQWNEKLLDGINTIGSPTVVAYKKKYEEPFDENLRMLVDVEMYYRMKKNNGNPLFIQDVLVVSCKNDESTLSTYSNNIEKMISIIKKESQYCKDIHNEI